MSHRCCSLRSLVHKSVPTPFSPYRQQLSFLSTHHNPLPLRSTPSRSFSSSYSSSSSSSPPPSSSLSPSPPPPHSPHERSSAVKNIRNQVGAEVFDKQLQDYLVKHRRQKVERKLGTVGRYGLALVIFALGASYAAVPLYRAFCSATGFAGTPSTDRTRMSPDRLIPTDSERRITIQFSSDTSRQLPWDFKPAQSKVVVRPGETALAFYTAKNNSSQDMIGISTYNVTPSKIAQYFAKVECFCFDEQRILAGEEVDLPVFFFIDRDFLDDPKMDDVEDVVLSYTFFKAKRNKAGHAVPDAPRDVVEKATGFEGFDLAPQNPE